MEATAKPRCKDSTDDVVSDVGIQPIMDQYEQQYPGTDYNMAHGSDFYPADYGIYNNFYEQSEKTNIGKRIQSGVIVVILLLLWFYTIGMFIKRSRFLRTTGQRQSSYKSVIPTTNTGGATTTTTTGTTAPAAVTSAPIPSSRRQSMGMNGGVPSATSNTKKSASVKSKCRESSSLSTEIPPFASVGDHSMQLQLEDSNSSPTHFRSGRHSLKICLPSWKIERSSESGRPSPAAEDSFSEPASPPPPVFNACDSFSTQSMYNESTDSNQPEVSIEVESHLLRQQKISSSSLLSPANGTEFDSLVISVDADYCNSMQNSQTTITNTNSLYDYQA